MSAADRVRDLAAALAVAVSDAETAGYVITWPRRASDLPGIGISATAKALASEAPAPKPAPRQRTVRKKS